MNSLKKIFLIIVLAFLGGVNVLIYWNHHLYSRAAKIEDNREKIETLEKAIDFYPANDLVLYELGRAYFGLGLDHLNDKALGVDYLQKSIINFSRSIRSNPSSYLAHYNLAQSLLYMSYLAPNIDISPDKEYRKAVALGGENSRIIYEVGKVFLSFWPQLPDDGKYPTGTTKYEKRNIGVMIPQWLPDVCIQCGRCSFVCPHATIRTKAYDGEYLNEAPETFKSADAKGKELKGMKFTVQIAPEDCTGCGACVNVCPGVERDENKNPTGRKAINMVEQEPVRETEKSRRKKFQKEKKVGSFSLLSDGLFHFDPGDVGGHYLWRAKGP